MTKDGQFWIWVNNNGETSYTALNGKPVDSKTIATRVAAGFSVSSGNDTSWQLHSTYDERRNFFAFWGFSKDVLWYLDRHGRLMGFNQVTGRSVGDITPPASAGSTRLILPNSWQDENYHQESLQLIATSNTVYAVNLDEHSLRPVLVTTDADPFVGLSVHERQHTVIVATLKTIRLVNTNWETLLSLPYQPDPATYPLVSVSSIEDTAAYAVEFFPENQLNQRSNWKMPERVIYFAKSGEVVKRLDLPALRDPDTVSGPSSTFDKITLCVLPPGLALSTESDRSGPTLELVLGSAVICAIAGFFLMRHFSFSGSTVFVWVLFIILTGFAGFMALYFTQEWPKREKCPTCGRPRSVERVECEHCRATFSPPAKTGTEIFEPLKPARL